MEMISKRHLFKAISIINIHFCTVLECKGESSKLKTNGNLRRTELSDNFDHGVRHKYARQSHGLVMFIIRKCQAAQI